MTFQAKKWGWKGMAARLLLVPVLAGTTAGVVAAQGYDRPAERATSPVSSVEKSRALIAQAKQSLANGDSAAAETYAKQAQDLKATLAYSETRPETLLAEIAKKKMATVAKATSSDPKELMKLGRQSLASGQLDQAQDFAYQADRASSSKGLRWGLFEDTPASLMKDVQESRAKADRVQSDTLFKKSKTLFAMPVRNNAERMQNLEQALNTAHQAKNLHGAYSMWDFSEKPDKLIGEIETAKATLRKKMPATAETSIAKSSTTKPAGMLPVAAKTFAGEKGVSTAMAELPAPNLPSFAPVPMPVVAELVNPAKAEVARLVAEGRTLLAKNMVVEARVKADAARKLAEDNRLTNAFGPGEDSPEQLFQSAQASGRDMIESLVKDADKQIAAKQTGNAQAALDTARQLSGGLGLYTKSIDDRLAKISPIAMPAGINVVGSLPTPSGETLVPVDSVKLPMAVAELPGTARVTGNTLLAQAEAELKRGNFEMAKTMAIQAHNSDPTAKANAQAMLRTIDVEATSANQKMATVAFANAVQAHGQKQYSLALQVFGAIDPALMTAEQKAKAADLMTDCMAKSDAPMAAAAIQQVVATEKPVSTLASEQNAMNEVAFQKLRQDGLDTMNAASAAWGRGETDAAIKILEEYAAKIRTSGQTAQRQANLLRGVETRLEGYGKLKHNIDVIKRETDEKGLVRKTMLTANVAEAQKQDEIKKKVAEINVMMKARKFRDAESLALQVKQLDLDDPTLTFIYEQAKNAKRIAEFKQIKSDTELMVLDGLNEASRQGPVLTIDDPLRIDPNRSRIAALRGEDPYQRLKTPTEQRIEQTLSTSFSLKAKDKPLRDVLDDIRSKSGLNIVSDDASLDDEKISLDSVNVTEDVKDLPLRDALSIVLEKARLSFVVENNVVKVTTTKRSKGRLVTKVFHVMDLVTPIPEYGLSPHHTLAGAIASTKALPNLGAVGAAGSAGITTPQIQSNGLKGGELVSGGNGVPGNGMPFLPGPSAGSLQSGITSAIAMSPQRAVYSQQLMNLVSNMIRPGSWQQMGGAGNIAYYDIGGAMVVNQTADVVREVQDLLDALRRLQDLSVAVEIRVVSLSETFFERVGVDFQANIKTNNQTLERQIATSTFRPEPFINDINGKGIVGYSPASGFSSDLGVPVRPSSFGLSLPPFGGYQPSLGPTTNGGLSLGLAFLNDIQVYMFLEAAQGNRRVNIMQAPKLTLFNGQTSTVGVNDLAFFTTGLQVVNVGGQFVYLPQNTAFPIGNAGAGGPGSPGVSITVQAVISADRRFVRLNLTPTLTALASATVPLFPITTFITPVFEGGSQGQPIPFTQFFQQPSFTEITAQTTVAVPDGGTVLLGGLKTLSQGRNEFGPPVLSQVPYLNRLFKNVGVGQETRHVMLMVTPRIIINSEEEARQTGSSLEGLSPGN